MRRIIITGTTGSGKTTLGRNLAKKLDIPSIDLDEINWLPGWQERDLQESRQILDTMTQPPAWVISGNYSKLQDVFWHKADTLIWLDYSFFRVFWQLLSRSIRRIVGKQAICNGNYEQWGKLFSRDSIMLWFFQTFYRRRRKGLDIFAHPEQNPHLTLVRFRHPREAALWLEGLQHDRDTSLLPPQAA